MFVNEKSFKLNSLAVILLASISPTLIVSFTPSIVKLLPTLITPLSIVIILSLLSTTILDDEIELTLTNPSLSTTNAFLRSLSFVPHPTQNNKLLVVVSLYLPITVPFSLLFINPTPLTNELLLLLLLLDPLTNELLPVHSFSCPLTNE